MSARHDCGTKHRFPNEVAALLFLQKCDTDTRQYAPCRTYRCPACRGWHLTSKPLRKKARR